MSGSISPEGGTHRGRVTNVFTEPKGSQLSLNAAAADSTLSVIDASFASASGGQVTLHDGLNVETVAYSGVSGNDLTGADARTADFAAGETLVRGFPFETTTRAEVVPDGVDSSVLVRVPFPFQGTLVSGSRDSRGEQAEGVLIQHDGSEWVVLDVLGQRPATGSHVFRHKMRFTASNRTQASEPFYGQRGNVFRVWGVRDDVDVDDLVVDVLVNGEVVATYTIPAGETKSNRVEVPLTKFLENHPFVVQVQP